VFQNRGPKPPTPNLRATSPFKDSVLEKERKDNEKRGKREKKKRKKKKKKANPGP
jgi:hypothetical protein